jgi:hypothetical protein
VLQLLSKAKRKPRIFNLLAGSSWLRLAERINSLSLAQDPPRTTRAEPDFGPWGFLNGELR